MRTTLWILLVLAGAAGCDDKGDAVTPDAPEVSVDAATVDAAPAAPISSVLDCGKPASAGGLTAGTDLQRVDVDQGVFPTARCNDGSAAVFYFRPASSPAARHRWVIQLQGGGSCPSPESCARRWCSVDTNFGMTQMSSALAPSGGIVGDGILRQGGALGEPNPLGDWNHVFVRYCSSDTWSGVGGAVDVDSVHPVSGAPVRFRVEFNGGNIVDAVVATLRRDGAAPPAYTLGGGSTELPDLDNAELVLFAGASAGSSGVTHNADRLRDLLRASNTACQGVSCPLGFWVLHDSGLTPPLEALDFSTTTMCRDQALCDYQTFISANVPVLWGPRGDESCRTWHAANDPATAFECDNSDHVTLHHVVAPMMIRMGQIDSLTSGNYVEVGFTVPGRGLMTVPLFAELVRALFDAMPQTTGTAEESAALAPARFNPRCEKHETISNDPAVYGVTVVADGAPRTMLELLGNAITGTGPTAAIWRPGDPVDCM